MKCAIPEISWHNREPVLSVDIHPISDKFYRLASGGADCHVLIWQLNICDNGAVKTEALSDLTRHQKAVNSVRWSPEGQYLATADDDANIIIWQLKTDNIPLLDGEDNDKNKEIWIINKVMRGHKEDIYDLCWSPNGQKLLSGSIDNTAILWDLAKGKSENILHDHKGFVQGVSWDPKNHYIATISTDRVCRVFDSSGKHVKARIQKGLLPVPEDHYLHKKDVKLFHDDTFKSFFRRLDFSPDGTLLAIPSGRVEIEDCEKVLNATYIFAVDSWTGPTAVFPSGKQCSTVVRFCPILFELHEDGPEAIISMPFRMILAIGTDHDIILYDTQQTAPFAYFKNIHYTRLTDLAWSKDGRLLVASSTDGFCALITFDVDELGIPYVKEESEVEDNIMNVSGCEEIVDKDEKLDVSKEKFEFIKPKKPSLLEKWTIKTPKKPKTCTDENSEKNNTKQSKDTRNKRQLEVDNEVPVIHKRIKPTPVPTDKMNDETVCVKKENLDTKQNSVKKKETATPLVNFLKGVKSKSDEKKKEPNSTPAALVDLTLDESEARDAFSSDSNEKTIIENRNTMDMEEYTEEFSLHLEDTNSADDVNNQSESQKNGDLTKSTVNEEINKIFTHKEIELVTQEQTVNVKDETKTKDCVHTTDKTEDCRESQKLLESTENKIVAKRRIPLITLSSPKHKKK